MENFKIAIATDFNDALGGRSKSLGPYSGEAFYEEVLKNKFEEAIIAGEKLHIYLDGTKGYGSSFLDQSFGELFRKHGDKVKNNIEFHTRLFDWIVDYIKTDIWARK